MSEEKKIILVTATTDLQKAMPRIKSWVDMADPAHLAGLVVVINGPRREVPELLPLRTIVVYHPEFLGSVPAFALGLQLAQAVSSDAHSRIAACFHDDLIIQEQNWTKWVMVNHQKPAISGFFGATQLGRDDIYKAPYEPWQLARADCWSNMQDAEAHGQRGLLVKRVAVLDGFSTIGPVSLLARVFAELAAAGIKHHAYDAAIGIYAEELAIPIYMLPVACHHLGGQTAVGDAEYSKWAFQQQPAGDQGFWAEAHKIVYEMGKGILPIKVGEPAEPCTKTTCVGHDAAGNPHAWTSCPAGQP